MGREVDIKRRSSEGGGESKGKGEDPRKRRRVHGGDVG